MVNDNNLTLGIDFGTSNSVACVIVDGVPTFIPSGGRYPNSFPSYVAFNEDGKIHVGEKARRMYVSHPDRVVRSIKRKMGDIEKNKYNGESYSPQQITAFILGKIKKEAEKYLNKKIKNAIITVPAYYDDNQRTATKDAARIAGLNVVELINEPTSASLAYGINNQTRGRQRILVFDMGAGTLDVTIMEYGAIFEVKSTSGDNHLGGNDMDNNISRFLEDEFKRQYGKKLKVTPQIKNRLIETAETAKIELSTVYETDIHLPFMDIDSEGNPLDLNFKFTRNELDNLVRPLVQRCKKPIEDALDGAGFTKNDIDKLILVGGPTKMPIVKRFVENLMGMSAEDSVDPMTCVAQGAALKGAVDTGGIVGVPDFVDVIPLSLGVISKGNITEVFVDRNTPVPFSKSRKFTTIKDNQSYIKIQIVQGEFRMADKNAYLGSLILNITPAPKGRVKVDITFNIDKNGILNVIAIDETTGNRKSLKLDSPNKLSEYEINQAIKTFELNAIKDEKDEILQLMKNDAHSVIEDAKNILETFHVGYSEKNNIETLINSLNEAINSDNETKIKIGTTKLKNVLYNISG